jgi:branched-chain amino acid transport system ATP-binding protein
VAILSRLASTGSVTVVLVEQRITSALEFAERAVILERGRMPWQERRLTSMPRQKSWTPC